MTVILEEGRFYTLPDGTIYRAVWEAQAGWWELETLDCSDFWIVCPSGALGKLSGYSEYTVDDLSGALPVIPDGQSPDGLSPYGNINWN